MKKIYTGKKVFALNSEKKKKKKDQVFDNGYLGTHTVSSTLFQARFKIQAVRADKNV